MHVRNGPKFFGKYLDPKNCFIKKNLNIILEELTAHVKLNT